MGSNLQDWLNLLLRWAHLIAGISWIGSSFYFMWLDSHLTEPEQPRADHKKGVEGELWMVHSGGFYQVEKRLIGPGEMPKTLHWFKWEATFTWITGFFLLGVVYYLSGGAMLVDPEVYPLTQGQAVGLSLGLLVVSWFAYDLLFQSRLARDSQAANVIALAAVVGLAYGLTHLFSGRAAYIHLGAVFGTLMVLNVWVRILPAQQAMIDATKEGRTPDFTLGKKAKRRSVHNSYMTFPVLFMMLSNHFPMTYGHRLSWVVLLLLVVLGAGVRHFMIVRENKGAWALVPAAAALVALVIMTTPASSKSLASAEGEPVAFSQVKSVIESRCIACHAANPVDRTFGPMPGGVSFESNERIVSLAERIRARAVDTKTMPFANKTGMTEEERALVGRWVSQGARAE